MTSARVHDVGLGAPPESRPWVESDELEAYLADAGASPEQARAIRDLARDGLAVLDLRKSSLLAECDRALEEVAPFFAEPRVDRVQDAWKASPAVRRLAGRDEVMEFLRLAYGREPFPFQTLNFQFGTGQHAHADAMHFHALPERFMCGSGSRWKMSSPMRGP